MSFIPLVYSCLSPSICVRVCVFFKFIFACVSMKMKICRRLSYRELHRDAVFFLCLYFFFFSSCRCSCVCLFGYSRKTIKWTSWSVRPERTKALALPTNIFFVPKFFFVQFSVVLLNAKLLFVLFFFFLFRACRQRTKKAISRFQSYLSFGYANGGTHPLRALGIYIEN